MSGQNKIIFVFIFLGALVVGLLVTYVMRALALRWHIGEMPDPRKVHTKFMPTMGGLGIYAGFLSGILLSALLLPDVFKKINQDYAGILLASFLVVALGIWDDLKGLDAGRKFLGQTIVATVIIAYGCVIQRISLPFTTDFNLGILAIPVTYLWLIGVSNAVNLLDGLDGLAAGVSLIASAVFAVLAYQNANWAFLIISLSLMGGLIGFLKFNHHPASIFMGDTGSLFLGMMLAALSIKGFETAPGRVGLLLPILILAIPIGDTSIAFFRRLNKGKHPFKPDKDHLHHRLIYLGLSHKQAVYIIYLAALGFAVTSYLLARHFLLVGGIALFLALLFSVLGLKRLGYLEAQRIRTYYGDHEIFTSKRAVAPINPGRIAHKAILILNDILMINLAFVLTWWLRYHSGWFENTSSLPLNLIMQPIVLLIVTLGWLGLFWLNNLYDLRWDVSRFDHLQKVSKVILFGILILFLLTLDPSKPFSQGRLGLFIYGCFLLVLVNFGRLFIIFFEKHFSVLEYAPHRTLLIGNTTKAKRLIRDIRNNPHLLYDLVGYVTREPMDKPFVDLPFLGTYDQVAEIVRRHQIEEIIVAVNERSRDEILNLVSRIDNPLVVFKVIPQMYDAVSGLKTEEVIGHPLIRLFPESMKLWQWSLKRLFDLTFALFLLIVLLPLFLLIMILQLLSGIYPVFEIVNCVGKYGRVFGLLNFATENPKTGKQPLIGKILYRTRLYKLPALINILLGKMSFVGPRPEKVEVVEKLRRKIKFYNRRFQVRPGLTGWAQVKYRYEEALKFKRDQLKQDLFYLENMSLSFDFRILLRSMLIFLGGKEAR